MSERRRDLVGFQRPQCSKIVHREHEVEHDYEHGHRREIEIEDGGGHGSERIEEDENEHSLMETQ